MRNRIVLEREVASPFPIAIAVTDIPAHGLVEIDFGAGTARAVPVAQLGVPGCRCGCMDGKLRGGT